MKQKRQIGIRAKIIAVIIPVVLVIIISFFALARKTVIDKSKENLSNETEKYAEEIQGWVNQIFGELQIYKDTIEQAGFQNDEEILKYMQTSLDVHEAYPAGLYMGDDTGAYLDASGWVPDGGWVLTERDWYVSGKENSILAFGNPYFDSNTKQMCVSAAVRMDYKPAVRVLAADVYLDYISELMSRVKIGKTGQAFLLTGNTGTVLAHPDEKIVNKTLEDKGLDSLYAEVKKAIEKNLTGLSEVKGSKGTAYIYISAIENTDWYFVTMISKSDVLSDLNRLQIIMLLIAIVAAAILIITLVHILNKIVRPVEKVAKVLTEVARGDFTQDIEIKGNDEIAVMGGNMQKFLAKMRKTISDITDMAGWLDRQSEQNERLSDSLTDSSRSQSEAVGALLNNVADLSDTARQVAEQMEQLAYVIDNTRTEGISAGEIMELTVQESRNGQKAIHDVKKGMAEIEGTVLSLEHQIRKTENAMVQIQSMVDLMMEIAEETNLLSLNASIEAARAGEAGKGFAVVAEQIGKLAANSRTAADDIAGLTAEIKNTVAQAAVHMKRSAESVQENVAQVDAAGTTFGTVFDKVQQSGGMVGRMVGMIEQVNQLAVQMRDMAKEQLDTARQINDSADKLGEYTSVVGNYSDTVAENAKELEKESKNLFGHMSQFRL